MKKTVLVIGSGGREHALAWKLSTSPQVGKVIVAPGNDGMSSDFERWKLPISGQESFRALAARALQAKVDLVVVGPDNPLAEGITDVLESQGLPVFGPSRDAAQIEASKAFAKEVMQAAEVPTARFFVAKSAAEAQKILKSVPWPPHAPGWVIKADGLALGKGVKVCVRYEEAKEAAEELIRVSGSLVIEERLVGEEISWMAFCDGERCALLEPARDHKRLLDQDEGPNTGGMGAYSPVPGVPSSFASRVREEVFLPTLREMKRRGMPFKGVLYAGLMADFSHDQFWVLEFNARFGDPETQVLLTRLAGDLYPWCEAVARGSLGSLPAQVPFEPKCALVVVGAARGYPEKPEKGRRIETQSPMDAPTIFWAGVARNEAGKLETSGGRVLGVMGYGADLKSARSDAYQSLYEVSFDGMQFRKDIGEQAR